jgi:hypothetical protein
VARMKVSVKTWRRTATGGHSKGHFSLPGGHHVAVTSKENFTTYMASKDFELGGSRGLMVKALVFGFRHFFSNHQSASLCGYIYFRLTSKGD